MFRSKETFLGKAIVTASICFYNQGFRSGELTMATLSGMIMSQFAITMVRLMAGIFLIASARAQGTFQNLDFESATLPPVPTSLQFGSAFPGWTGCVGGVPLGTALYNNEFLDSSGISIVDRNSIAGSVIQGNYTAILQAGLALGTPQPADTTLSQTGLVPSGTQSLLFQARFTFGQSPTSFAVTMDGQNLSLVPQSSSGGNTLYSADVRQWAGQTATLDFTVFAARPHIDNAFLTLDAIQFYPVPVPEPGVFCLFAVGSAVLGCRAFSNSRRRRISRHQIG